MKKKVIIALGGNALIKKNQKGNIYEQFANTRTISESIVKMIKENYKVVITHGNGPQVGSILLQNNAARDELPPMPLGICVAESEGLIGYMIQQCMYNELMKSKIEKDVVTLITQVLVDKNDSSFSNPIKPIGPLFNKFEAKELIEDGYKVKKITNGWRIVVPSPDPIKIIEGEIIKKLVDEDIIIIAAGGGGMPVVNNNSKLDGVEAVVDKDLASECLAESIGADILMILTNVDRVYLNYNKSNQKGIDRINLIQLKKYYKYGHFPDGSMGPKILAAIRFLEYGGEKVIISNVDQAWESISGKIGTHIIKN
ncbi:MAG: carbamate kinase [Candidatus Thermoplasmatota archaeon]